MSEWLTPAQVAAELQVSRRTVGRWIDSGDLPALRVGSVVRVGRQALVEWQRRHEINNRPDGEQTTASGASAPAATTRAPLPLGSLPADYTPIFPELWQTDAALPAAARGRTTKAKNRPA